MLETKYIIYELNILYKTIYAEISKFSTFFILKKLPDSYITNDKIRTSITHTGSYGELIRESNPACVYDHYIEGVAVIKIIIDRLTKKGPVPKFNLDKYYDLWDSNIGFPRAIREFYEAMYYTMKGNKLHEIEVRGNKLLYLGETKEHALKEALFEIKHDS